MSIPITDDVLVKHLQLRLLNSKIREYTTNDVLRRAQQERSDINALILLCRQVLCAEKEKVIWELKGREAIGTFEVSRRILKRLEKPHRLTPERFSIEFKNLYDVFNPSVSAEDRIKFLSSRYTPEEIEIAEAASSIHHSEGRPIVKLRNALQHPVLTRKRALALAKKLMNLSDDECARLSQLLDQHNIFPQREEPIEGVPSLDDLTHSREQIRDISSRIQNTLAKNTIGTNKDRRYFV